GPYTISAWVRPRQCHGTGRIAVFSKYSNANGSDSARGWTLQVGNNADWRLSNAPKSLATGTTASINADYFQSGTCTAGEVTYLSGTYNNPDAPVVGTPAGVSLWVNDTASAQALGAGGAQGSSIGDKAIPYIGRIHNA